MRKILLIIFFGAIAVFTWNFFSIETNLSDNQPILRFADDQMVAYAADPSFMTEMLQGTNINSRGEVTSLWFFNLYKIARGILNISLFAFLIYVAFRNILNLNIETYSIKKIMPRLIFGAFLGNLLLPLAVIASSMVDALQASVPMFHPPTSLSWIGLVSGGLAVASVGQLLAFLTIFIHIAVASLLILAPLALNLGLVFGLLMLGLFQSLRPWIVLLAIAFGPVAIGLSILPETEGIFKRWYKIATFWLFYPLLLALVYYLAMLIPSMKGAVGDGFLSSLIGNLIPMVLKIALFAVAVRAPFTWEKDVTGMIAAIPGQAQKAYKQATQVADYARKVPRVAYEVRKNFEEKGTKLNMAKLRQGGKVTDRAREMMAGEQEGVVNQKVRNQASMAQRQDILSMSDEQRQQIYGSSDIKEITPAKIAQAYQKYDEGGYSTDMADSDPAVAAAGLAGQEYFSNLEANARKSVLGQYESKANKEMEREEAGKMANHPWAKYLKWESKWGAAALISGAAGAIRNNSESDNKEEEKEMKRENAYYKNISSRLARGRSEDERIASDVANATRTEDLEEYQDTFHDILDNIYEKATNLSKDEQDRKIEALAYMREILDHLKNQGENPAGWDRNLWALAQNWKGGRSFEDTMHRAKPVWQRLSVLINQEARSSVPKAEQDRRQNQAFNSYMLTAWDNPGGEPPMAPTAPGGGPSGPSGGSGGPSGGFGGPSGSTGSPIHPNPGGADDAPTESPEISNGLTKVSQGLRDINESINNLSGQLTRTSGAPLERIRRLMSNQNTKSITGEDIDILGEDTENGLHQISSILTDKNPDKADLADEIAIQLDGAKGGLTPELLDTIQKNFYPGETIDPRISKLTNIVSSEPIVERAFEDGQEENQTILKISQRLASSGLTTEKTNQIHQSIDIFNQSQSEPNSVNLEELKRATDMLASQIGLPPGTQLKSDTVNQISRALLASTTNTPEDKSTL